MDDDDFFGDEEGPSMGEREVAAVERRVANDGYREGLELGREKALQDGFDAGYAVGAEVGWKVGQLYGVLAVAAENKTGVQEELLAEVRQAALDGFVPAARFEELCGKAEKLMGAPSVESLLEGALLPAHPASAKETS